MKAISHHARTRAARGPRAGLLRGHAAMKAISHHARTRAACAPRASAPLIKGLSLNDFYLHRLHVNLQALPLIWIRSNRIE